MTNEHNPIAIRIGKIQNKWVNSVKNCENLKFVRFVINEEDLPLVNGFYKLESSPYGKINELLVVMLTDFKERETFAYHVANDWVNEYEKGLQQYPDLPWKEFSVYKEKIQGVTDIKNQEHLLVDLLENFQKYIPGTSRRTFLLGLVPRAVSSYEDFSIWLDKILSILPERIGVTLIDYKNGTVYDSVIEKYAFQSVSIELEDMDMKGAYEELAQYGDPNNPEVQIRKLMLKMGKAMAASDEGKVCKLGDEAIEIGRTSGNNNLWAYAHLIYAGFLFRFKNKRIQPLLDKGISISETSINQGNSSAISILLSLISYKASYYKMKGENKSSYEWFVKGTDEAIKYNSIIAAISSCKNALIVANRHGLISEITDYLDKVFPLFYKQSDEELKVTEFFALVNFYIYRSELYDSEKIKNIENRMVKLYGENWKRRSILKSELFTNSQNKLENAFS